MEMPLKKVWVDKRELAQVVRPNSCLVIKDGDDIVGICNIEGNISVKKFRV